MLIRFEWEASASESLPAALSGVLAAGGFAASDLAVHRPLSGSQAYGYLFAAPDTRSADDGAFERLRLTLAGHLREASAVRLEALMEIDGAAKGKPATHHYVVETDVARKADADLNAWYDQEHLPGLAAVPGTVRAARYRNLDGGPRYHACYGLAARETFESAAWLRARATEWSSRVRPAFENTRRAMFRTVAPHS